MAKSHHAEPTVESKDLLVAASSESPLATVRDLDDPELYFNRELSLLDFQRRVLEEARDHDNPLLERVKFLSILGSNIDELFMVRVAGLKQQLASGSAEVAPDGRSVSAQLQAIRQEVPRITGEAYRCLNQELLPALSENKIRIIDLASLPEADCEAMNTYFSDNVFPVLTPLAFDPGRPFPHISSLSLNLAVMMKDSEGEQHFARVKIPNTLRQLIRVPCALPGSNRGKGGLTFIWIEQLIAANLTALFPGLEISGAYPFRVTRDAEVAIKELESDDLLETIEEAVWQRRFRAAVRLQIGAEMPEYVLSILTSNLEVDPKDVYRIEGPIDLGRLHELADVDRPDLKYKTFVPATPATLLPAGKEDMFALVRQEDLLLHHPFQSFQPVVDFLRQAARDPDVLAIKMTLYRVGRNSPIVAALLEAIEHGKQVAVLVELKARFDEESNIEWARELESEGVHVVYGLPGLKVHCKVALVVRKEGDSIRRYMHLGTGNYNATTARLYTDIGLFTANPDIGRDVTHLFNYLTGYSSKHSFRKLLVAPISLRQGLENLIRREIGHAERGEQGRMILKMNALEDAPLIRLLYEASAAGVDIELLVRGICCLRPGITGVSDNIRVTSIVGQFLEHSRIYYFNNAGADEVYLGSADVMPRNLNRRVETLFPVEDPKLMRRLRDEVLATYLADEVKARHLQSDGSYTRGPGHKQTDALNSQTSLLARAHAS
jgi:polyphosphate kinase